MQIPGEVYSFMHHRLCRQTLLVMPNLISAFRELDCSTNVYWGTSAGRSQYFGDYFRGLAYAMSWPLVSRDFANASNVRTARSS